MVGHFGVEKYPLPLVSSFDLWDSRPITAYVSQIICLELINRHYNNPFVGHFGIMKMQKLIARKYYWPILQKNVKVYTKNYDIYLTSKVICHKPYKDLQLFFILTY